MRSLRTLSAFLAIVALAAACTAAKPGWTYAPAPSATPLPSASASGSVEPSGSASAAPSAPPSASASASSGATVVEIVAEGIAFTTPAVTVPADTPFQIDFKNQDAGIPHNVEIKDAAGAAVFRGEIFNGVDARVYDVPALAAGDYPFTCSVHPNMTGTLTAE